MSGSLVLVLVPLVFVVRWPVKRVGTGADVDIDGGIIYLGNLGTVGRDGGGGGCSNCNNPVPNIHRALCDVIPGEPEVHGSFDQGIVRRVVRRHQNEVRLCYERELLHTPGLQGRVVVRFAISPAGEVGASAIQTSTVNSANVEECIVEAVRRWEFPKPRDDDGVMVSFPFLLKAADTEGHRGD
jgi:TonB family protein